MRGGSQSLWPEESQCRWLNGGASAALAGGPGSIPGQGVLAIFSVSPNALFPFF